MGGMLKSDRSFPSLNNVDTIKYDGLERNFAPDFSWAMEIAAHWE